MVYFFNKILNWKDFFGGVPKKCMFKIHSNRFILMCIGYTSTYDFRNARLRVEVKVHAAIGSGSSPHKT